MLKRPLAPRSLQIRRGGCDRSIPPHSSLRRQARKPRGAYMAVARNRAEQRPSFNLTRLKPGLYGFNRAVASAAVGNSDTAAFGFLICLAATEGDNQPPPFRLNIANLQGNQL